MNTIAEEVFKRIKAYCICELIEGSARKTPKYRLSKIWGSYPPFERMKVKRGECPGAIEFALHQKREGEKASSPEWFLQAPGDFRFTGLRYYFVNGFPSGYAYGFPYQKPIYGKARPKPNPCYPNHTGDGYFFIMHDFGNVAFGGGTVEYFVPKWFELIIIDGGKLCAELLLKSIKNGAFDEEIKRMRAEAQDLTGKNEDGCTTM